MLFKLLVVMVSKEFTSVENVKNHTGRPFKIKLLPLHVGTEAI